MSVDKIEMRSRAQLLGEIEELRTRLDEAEQTLQAIRSGEVDALVVEGPQGEQVFSLTGVESVYRVIVETMNEAALTVSPQGDILFCNRRLADLMHTPMHEVVGRKFADFVEVSHRPVLMDLIRQAQMEPARTRIMLLSPDGSRVPAQISASLLNTGALPCTCLVASDLTQLEASADLIRFLEENQEALRQSELRFRALTEKSGELITVLDATGVITYNLAGANSTLGYAPAELVGHNAFELVHPDDLPRLVKLFQEGIPQVGKVEQAEFRLRAKDGSWRWQLAVGTNLLHEPAVGGILINSRDITERKQDEDRLRRSEERYRTLFSTLIEGFCIIEVIFDSDGRASDYRVLEVNPAFEAQTGLKNAQGRLMRELVPDYETYWFETYGNVALTGQSVRFVNEAKALGRWFDVSAYRVGGPESRNVAILFNDVTESKLAGDAVRAAKEKLEERVQERTAELKERAEQLARLSSQLTMAEQLERNRLAQILHDGLQQYLMAAKLQAGELIERATDVAIKQSADGVEKLLSESIRVSRTLAAELSPRILHESGLIAGLEWLSRWMSGKHGLKIEIMTQMDAPVLAEDVKLLLFESVRELLLNVVKHAKTHSARVSLSREDGRFLQIVVSDNGVGFEPARAGAMEGGFGLFSIRERVGLIGGTFEVDSSPGKGARFTLRAPLAIHDPLESIPCAQPVEIDPTEGTCLIRSMEKIRILLVDDHPAMRDGLARLLDLEIDFEVVGQASDGQDAVKLAGTLIPDVILMDLSMPRMNGIDATRVIHEQYPDIRIIGLSLYQEEERAQAMLDSGAVLYLTKTCAPAELKTAIRSSVRELI